MKKLEVCLPEKSYEIRIGAGIFREAAREIARLAGGENIAVISDENVWRLHGEALRETGLSFQPIIMEPGEGSKSLRGLERVYTALAQGGIRRGGLVVAFGGGVIGDLAGYAAASWLRGVRYMQIPTTLLAQVDSSVGGKTAINLACGKNMAGAFHHPEFVIVDTDWLKTLPAREYACGMGEVVKYGAIRSAELFTALGEKEPPLADIIEECLRIKADIVGRDARDNGERKLLNFGHTFGHAVEALGNFSAYNHGEAVAIGMVMAADFGESIGYTPKGCAQALRGVLHRHALPEKCPYSARDMLPLIARDKKSTAQGVELILLRDIGNAAIRHTPVEEIQRFLEANAYG